MVDLKIENSALAVNQAEWKLDHNKMTLGEFSEVVAPYRTVVTLDNLRTWLSSFDSNSATECFTAVNVLKERLEDGNDN